jgi:hypothetical protein
MNNIADGSVNIQPCIGYLAHPFEKEPPWVCIILRFLMAEGYSTIDRRRKLFSYTRENTDGYSLFRWWIISPLFSYWFGCPSQSDVVFSIRIPLFQFQAVRTCMTFSSLLLLLLFCFLLCLAWLWHLDWAHHGLRHLAAKTAHPIVHRLLKPRTPLDCPACRLASPASSSGGRAPAPVRPWREVKSRRGAPKRVNTEGFACPNQQCAYCGIAEAHIHALIGDGKHGQAERIQTFRGPACHTTFTARRHTPLYRLRTPSLHIGMVLSALAV